jgi:hypothetical protein
MPGWRVVLNRAGLVVLGLLAVLIALLLAWRLWVMPVYARLPNVAHAGGAIGNATYINGLTALDSSYANGFRRMELDFERTSDGVLVCGHDWNGFNGKPPDLAGFLTARTAMKYPPCTIEELVGWFRAHPDTQLISDAKAEFAFVDTPLQAALGNQLMPEVYAAKDVSTLAAGGRRPFIPALYKLNGLPARLGFVAALHGQHEQVSAVAMSQFDAFFGLALWSKAWLGAPVYVYTENTCDTAPVLHALGVDAIYTDDLMTHSCQ